MLGDQGHELLTYYNSHCNVLDGKETAMILVRSRPEPLRGKWYNNPYSDGESKELAGRRSLFHRHCGAQMVHVVIYQIHSDGKIRRIVSEDLICPVCDCRRVEPSGGSGL